jgi:DNA-binding MarR family transcriptional regulator
MASPRSTTDTADTLGPTGDLSGDSAAMAGRLRLSATRLARQLRRQADTGLSPSQLSALATVNCHGPLTLGELSTRERVAPPSVTRVVARLEDDGLVERRPDPDDRRVTRVRITPDGEALVLASRRRKDAWLTGRIDALDAAGRARLAAALDVLDALTEEEP